MRQSDIFIPRRLIRLPCLFRAVPYSLAKKQKGQKERDYSREGDYLWKANNSNIAHWLSCPKYVFFIIPLT